MPGRHGGDIRTLIGGQKDIRLMTIYGYTRLVGFDEKLTLQTEDGFFRTDLSGLIDLEEYYIDQHPPGLIAMSKKLIRGGYVLAMDPAIGDHPVGDGPRWTSTTESGTLTIQYS